jgi:sialic acid synthase SpsE
MIWVAEIGSAHGGCKSTAFEMIRQAKMVGATIAKFQLGWTPTAQRKYAGNVNNIRHIDHWAFDLNKWCEQLGIEFMASIWSEEGLAIAKTVGMKRYKIAHQMDDFILTEQVLDLERETFISYGTDKLYEFSHPEHMRWIYCASDYPQYDLDMTPWFGRPYEEAEYYGYSSHMHGIADALIAVIRGAKYIEKHVTLNKADKTIRDHSFALDFGEFKQMVEIGNEIHRLC